MKLRRFLITFVILTPLLMAFTLLSEVSPEVMTAVAFIISVLVGLIGPKPIGKIIVWFKLTGQWATLFVYFAAVVVGILALLLAKGLAGINFTWDNALAIAGIIYAASQYAFHRLKDLGEI